MKKVLVTGATGKTGSLVLKKLRQQPSELTALGFARSPEKVKAMFGSTENFFLGDIRDRFTLDRAIVDCNALVIETDISQVDE